MPTTPSSVPNWVDDPETVERHRAWRRIAWDASLSRDEFLRGL
jgi:hypothetical protein